ncbi:MAG: hypothetical protein ACI8XG_001265 [Congregibacter sp.]|jgi:hypothetical protein
MKMKLSTIVLVTSLFASNLALAATDIGLGTIKAVKVYDLGLDKSIKVIFNDDVTYENTACNKTASFTYSQHNKEFVDRALSLALSAYMSGKKVRITSEGTTCEGSLISLQEIRL